MPPPVAEAESAEGILRDIPFFRTLDRLAIARRLGTLVKTHLPGIPYWQAHGLVGR
jgi:hypothetical protein